MSLQTHVVSSGYGMEMGEVSSGCDKTGIESRSECLSDIKDESAVSSHDDT